VTGKILSANKLRKVEGLLEFEERNMGDSGMLGKPCFLQGGGRENP
jgi:hypothetical protein